MLIVSGNLCVFVVAGCVGVGIVVGHVCWSWLVVLVVVGVLGVAAIFGVNISCLLFRARFVLCKKNDSFFPLLEDTFSRVFLRRCRCF